VGKRVFQSKKRGLPRANFLASTTVARGEGCARRDVKAQRKGEGIKGRKKGGGEYPTGAKRHKNGVHVSERPKCEGIGLAGKNEKWEGVFSMWKRKSMMV